MKSENYKTYKNLPSVHCVDVGRKLIWSKPTGCPGPEKTDMVEAERVPWPGDIRAPIAPLLGDWWGPAVAWDLGDRTYRPGYRR